MSAYTGLGLAARKVSNSSTESDSCFGSYTDEIRSGAAGEEMLLSDLVIIEKSFHNIRRRPLNRAFYMLKTPASTFTPNFQQGESSRPSLDLHQIM